MLQNSVLFLASSIVVTRTLRKARLCGPRRVLLKRAPSTFHPRLLKATLDASFGETIQENNRNVRSAAFDGVGRRSGTGAVSAKRPLWNLIISSVVETALVAVSAVVGVIHTNAAQRPIWGVVILAAAFAQIVTKWLRKSYYLYALVEEQIRVDKESRDELQRQEMEATLGIRKHMVTLEERLDILQDAFDDNKGLRRDIENLQSAIAKERKNEAILNSKNKKLEDRSKDLQHEKERLHSKYKELRLAEQLVLGREKATRAELEAVSAQLEQVADSHTRARHLEEQVVILQRRLTMQESTIQELHARLDTESNRIRESQRAGRALRRKVNRQSLARNRPFWSPDLSIPDIIQRQIPRDRPQYYPPKQMKWPHSPLEAEDSSSDFDDDTRRKSVSINENAGSLYNFSRGEFIGNQNQLAPQGSAANRDRSSMNGTLPLRDTPAGAENDIQEGRRQGKDSSEVDLSNALRPTEGGLQLTKDQQLTANSAIKSLKGAGEVDSTETTAFGEDMGFAAQSDEDPSSKRHEDEIRGSTKRATPGTPAVVSAPANSIDIGNHQKSSTTDACMGSSGDDTMVEDEAAAPLQKEMIIIDRNSAKLPYVRSAEEQLIASAKKDLAEARKKETLRPQAEKLYGNALTKLKEALEVSNRSVTSLFEYGTALLGQAKSNLNADWASNSLEEARRAFEDAWALKPGDEAILFNRGLAVSLLAALKGPLEGEIMYKEACDHYENLLHANSASKLGAFNCGLAYFSRARLAESANEPQRAKDLYGKALHQFTTSDKLQPGNNKTDQYLRQCKNALGKLN